MAKIRLLLLTIALGICFIFCFLTEASCETSADEELQNDILNNLAVIDPNTNEPLHPEIVSQEILKVEQDEKSGQWQKTLEEWVVSLGKEERTFVIQITPSEVGGVYFTIMPKHIAEEEGLLE